MRAFPSLPRRLGHLPLSVKARGVALHLLDLGGDISGNGLSKLFLTIAAAFAEAERDRIRERIGQVKADQKARGRYPRASSAMGAWQASRGPPVHKTGPNLIGNFATKCNLALKYAPKGTSYTLLGFAP